MEQAKNLGAIALWLMGHLAFTVVVNLTAIGGYYVWSQVKGPIQIDLAQMTSEDKQALASALIDDGYSVPRNVEEKKRRG